MYAEVGLASELMNCILSTSVNLYGAAPERIECGLGVSRQACAAQPPSDSSAAEAFSSQTCAALILLGDMLDSDLGADY